MGGRFETLLLPFCKPRQRWQRAHSPYTDTTHECIDRAQAAALKALEEAGDALPEEARTQLYSLMMAR